MPDCGRTSEIRAKLSIRAEYLDATTLTKLIGRGSKMGTTSINCGKVSVQTMRHLTSGQFRHIGLSGSCLDTRQFRVHVDLIVQ